jgi:glutamine---fructose-6-phosphate transaminase (isomerizing)
MNPSQMGREICEQPETIAATLDALLPAVPELRALATGCRALTFYARGSSDTAAVYGRYLGEIQAGIPSALGAPSVATLYGARPDLRGTLAVVVSQSGHTTEMVDVARWARERGARTVGVTNEDSSPLVDAVDVALVTRAGVERAVPATKTHTAQLVAMAVLALALRPDDEAARQFREALHRSGAEAARLLDDNTSAAEITRAVTAFAPAAAVVVTGRSYTMATALELALKLQETTGIPAIGLSGADLQHGPSAMERADVPMLIAASPGGPTSSTLHACAETAHRRGSVVVTIGGDAALRASSDVAIAGPALPEAVAPIVSVIPGQVLVEALARRRGFDPDQPHGLSKVTQTAQ